MFHFLLVLNFITFIYLCIWGRDTCVSQYTWEVKEQFLGVGSLYLEVELKLSTLAASVLSVEPSCQPLPFSFLSLFQLLAWCKLLIASENLYTQFPGIENKQRKTSGSQRRAECPWVFRGDRGEHVRWNLGILNVVHRATNWTELVTSHRIDVNCGVHIQ